MSVLFTHFSGQTFYNKTIKMKRTDNRANSAKESATSARTTEKTYSVRCLGLGKDADTIVRPHTDRDKALMSLASRISECSTSIHVDEIETLSEVRDIVEYILSYDWTPEEVERTMEEYDSEDDTDVSKLRDYIEYVIDDTSSDYIESLCSDVYDSTGIVKCYDTFEEMYEYWMDCKLPE